MRRRLHCMCVVYRLHTYSPKMVWFVCFANLAKCALLETAAFSADCGIHLTFHISTVLFMPHGVIKHCTIKNVIDTFLLLSFFLFEYIHCVILASAGKFPTMPSFIYRNSIKRHLSEFTFSEHSLYKGLRSFMDLVSRINITLWYDNDSSQGGPPTLVKLKVNIYSVFVRF